MDLKENEDASQRFETIWNHVECGISIVDAMTHEILDINPVAARMFGDDKEKIIGKRCHRFICPAEDCACPITDKGQVVDRSERKFVRADGSMIPIIKSVAKIQYRGRLALLESFTDLSPLKEAEAKLVTLQVAERANQAKSDFLSHMSHEMRTPMNAIIGMAKIADGAVDVDKLKYCLGIIGNSAKHLLALINDILDMSKIEAGKFELHSAPFDLEEALITISNLILEKTEEKRIRFSVALDAEPGARFIGDVLRISQIITNLLANAVKFTHEGGSVSLSVSEAERRENSSLLRFSVTDTGIGMTDEQMTRLFKVFEQADSSITSRFGGTGLGLAISKNIAEKMNGSIRVASSPGQGSTFTMDLELASASASALPDDLDAAGTRLLIVDADAEARRQFRSMAARFGFAADEAASVAEALSSPAALAAYSAVFLDVRPADMEPLEAVRCLGGKGGNRVIMMGSFRDWNTLDREARLVGVAHFVSKPLFPTSLLTAVRAVLGKAAADKGIPDQADDGKPDFSSASLLLVEDVPINREIFVTLLEETGVRIDEAEDGYVALEQFKQNPDKYDMIIMDVQMPGLDGLETTRAIRASGFERGGSIPIIAMTASMFREDIEKCLAAGMNDHLAKPIDEKEVFRKIAAYAAKPSS